MKRLRKILWVLPFIFILSCENKDDVKLAQAQQCLDNASVASAMTCIDYIEGLESPAAYSLRCAARYLSEGFTNSRFVGAFKDLKKSNGQDQMSIAMAYLTVDDNDTADAISSDCLQSGVASMIGISQLTVASTLITTTIGSPASFGPNGLTDPTDMQDVIDFFETNATTQQKESLGTVAISMHDLYCGPNGSGFKDTSICTNLDAAVTSNDPATVANALLDQLQNAD